MSEREHADDVARLFAVPPAFDDADAFVQKVEQRTHRGWCLRIAMLTVAGGIGGVLAVREALDAGVIAGVSQISEVSTETTRSSQSLDLPHLLSLLSAAEGGVSMGVIMPAFWLLSAGVIAAAMLSGLRANAA